MGNNVSMIDGHIDDPNPIYIVYDSDGASETPVYGVFTTYELAIKACDWLVDRMVAECLAEDPKESGLDEETDKEWLIKDCRRGLAIQTIASGINRVELASEIKLPYGL
jgi:hypothetical protein